MRTSRLSARSCSLLKIISNAFSITPGGQRRLSAFRFSLAFPARIRYNKQSKLRNISKGLISLANQKKMVDDITSMDVDFSKWYTDIVKKAELMDYSSVKGCMIIEPYGYAIWETFSMNWTIALRRRVTRTFTCRCSSRNPSCRRKKTT